MLEIYCKNILTIFFVFTQAFADLNKSLKPLVDGVKNNKHHWTELAQTAKETIKNRKNSLKSHVSNGSVKNNNSNNNNNNYFNPLLLNANINISNNNNNNNNNGDELSNASSDSLKMSKIVGKFPLDINGVNSIFSPAYIKPQNGIINSCKAPSIVSYTTSWKNNEDHEAMNQ